MDRLFNKLNWLPPLLQGKNPDFVVITEHGLKQSVIQNTHILSYSLLEEYSRTNYKKAIVAIYKNDNIFFTAETTGMPNHSGELQC